MPIVLALVLLTALGLAERRASGARATSPRPTTPLPYGATLPGGAAGAAVEQWTVPTSKEEAIQQGIDKGAQLTGQAVTAFTSDSPAISCWVYKASGKPRSQWPLSVQKACPP